MDSAKLPIAKKKNLDVATTTKAQRRKNFNPRKWASKYLRDGGGLPAMSSLSDMVEHEGVTCTKCGTERFAHAYGFPNPKTFVCDSCK